MIMLFTKLGIRKGASRRGRSNEFSLTCFWDGLNAISRTQMDLRGWSSERVPCEFEGISDHSKRVGRVRRQVS